MDTRRLYRMLRFGHDYVDIGESRPTPRWVRARTRLQLLSRRGRLPGLEAVDVVGGVRLLMARRHEEDVL